MRLLIILFFLFQSVISVGQKTYQIEKASWTYAKPENYKARFDNFSSLIKTGDSVIKKNSPLQKQSNSDSILFSFYKKDSANMNIILAAFKINSNIEKFTLPGYVDKLAEFMKYNYIKMGTDAAITSKEIFIDKIKFFVVEGEIYVKEKNYTYWTAMYVTELSQKEFTVSIVYDNEKDKTLLTESILNSKFTTN